MTQGSLDNVHTIPSRLPVVMVGALLLFASLGTEAYAQTELSDSALSATQTVRSIRGYMIRIPGVAHLDSSRSGWSPTERFEQRVYKIAGSGEIQLRVEIGEQEIPEDARQEGAYMVIDTDSVTSAGTLYTRTWYLEHRRVTITLLPYGIAMKRVIDRREEIYRAFRWSPGADSDALEIRSEGTEPITPPAMNTLGR